MRKVFIDAGAFNGDTVQLFRQKYPGAEEFDIFCFEPNPAFAQNFAREDVSFFPKAVWVEDGPQKFYLAENPIGSTLLKEKKTGRINVRNPITVDCVDLNRWIIETFSPEDFIVLKMDIEGAEYQVLRKMLDEGSIKYVKALYVDWHAKKIGLDMDVHQKLIEELTNMGLKPKDMCGETQKIEI